MSINQKKIISTTILFIVIVAAIVGFKSVFGDINTLVGVAGITAALSLLGTDYTINPIKNTIYFVGIEVGIGIAAYLASTNAILGLIITFIVIFSILYAFTYNTKKPTYIAFTLGYLFMLYTPVNIKELPTRLAGLAFCGLAIMALQMLANKNKLQKQAKSTMKNSVKAINEEIDIILNNENIDTLNSLNIDIYNNLRSLSSDIYKRIDQNIELPTELMQALFIGKFLESINLTLQKIKNENEINKGYNESLNKMKELLNNIEEFTEGKLTIEEVITKLENFLKQTKEINSRYYLTYELQDGASILKDDLKELANEGMEKIHKRYFTTNILKNLNDLKHNMNKDSLKFTFALRGAIVTSIGVFIVSAFNIEYGKWLVFSLSSIVQPYLEASQAKGKERIIGTIIGLIAFEILFYIVKDQSGRTMIILLVGYISNYQVKYKDQMICTTISALGAASMTGSIETISINRIAFVLIGTIIALYANKVILPYRMDEITKKEINKVIKLNEKIVTKLYELGKNKKAIDEETKGLLITNELVNKKIYANNATLLSKNIEDFLYNQRIFMNEIRFLVNNFKKTNKNGKQEEKLFKDIDLLLNKENKKEEVIELFKHTEENFNKLVLIDAMELRENILSSKKISRTIAQEL